MPTTKRTENDDEILAEQWMLESGYVDRPPRGVEDPYKLRRVMRMCYAAGVTNGRSDGLKHPHFTRKEIETVGLVFAARPESLDHVPLLRHMLIMLFPEATFDE